MINKKCSGTEQLLVMVEWDMAQAFISAAAIEKPEHGELQHVLQGVYEDEGLTVKGAWGMDLTSLRMPEAPILKIPPAGALEKCKWWMEHHRRIRRSKRGAPPRQLIPCGTRARPGAVLVSRRGQCLRHRTRWPG
jgi:hypothetical protein